jgi:hypothetical protein
MRKRRCAYAADLANFEAWFTKHGFSAMPATPEVVGAYLAAAGEGYAMPTLRRRVAAIARECGARHQTPGGPRDAPRHWAHMRSAIPEARGSPLLCDPGRETASLDHSVNIRPHVPTPVQPNPCPFIGQTLDGRSVISVN